MEECDVTCEHNNGINPCREPATWIGTRRLLDGRAFCDKHKQVHAAWEGEHFVPLTPELEAKRLEQIAAAKACPKCGTIHKP